MLRILKEKKGRICLVMFLFVLAIVIFIMINRVSSYQKILLVKQMEKEGSKEKKPTKKNETCVKYTNGINKEYHVPILPKVENGDMEEIFPTLQIIPDSQILELYQTLYDIHDILTEEGIVPWDEEADIGVYEKDRPKLEKLLKTRFLNRGYGTFVRPCSKIGMLKIFRLESPLFASYWEDSPKDLFRIPWIDVFFLKEYKSGKIDFACDKNVKHWPTQHFYQDELYPLKQVKFGNITLNIPNKPIVFLDRHFKKDWNETFFVKQHPVMKDVMPIYKKVKYKVANKKMKPSYYRPAKPLGPIINYCDHGAIFNVGSLTKCSVLVFLSVFVLFVS